MNTRAMSRLRYRQNAAAGDHCIIYIYISIAITKNQTEIKRRRTKYQSTLTGLRSKNIIRCYKF